mgnify:CR=1 FL=1
MWIWPWSSLHSAGIGFPELSRRYQSWTETTVPFTSTRIAFLTFAAASAAMRLSNMPAYGTWLIHQIIRKLLVGSLETFVDFLEARFDVLEEGFRFREELARRFVTLWGARRMRYQEGCSKTLGMAFDEDVDLEYRVPTFLGLL